MESILIVSRILSKYRSNFGEGGIDLTLNEALILEVVKNNVNTKRQISNSLLKDSAYVIRVVNKLIKRGLIEENRRALKLTEKGLDRWERCSQVCEAINQEWKAERSIYDRRLDEETRKNFIKLVESSKG
jgi:DNA-binding MarR family transcriptional regulator